MKIQSPTIPPLSGIAKKRRYCKKAVLQKGGIVKSAVFFKRQYWKNGSIVKTATFSFGIKWYLRNRKYLFETLKWAVGKVGGGQLAEGRYWGRKTTVFKNRLFWQNSRLVNFIWLD